MSITKYIRIDEKFIDVRAISYVLDIHNNLNRMIVYEEHI
ncbi:hypothetical protein BH09PAT2_BH09PAT2_07100 [soil metagenome]